MLGRKYKPKHECKKWTDKTMPELSNIQTYEKLIGEDYQPTLDRFKTVLQQIDLWNDEIQHAFESFEWKVDDNGFVYSSIVQLGHFKTKFSDIAVRPLVLVYTPAIDKSFTNNWIVCDLLIEIEKLRSYDYFQSTYSFVKSLTLEMHREFKQTGVYFTDEAQDGQDFDGIRNANKEKLWEFDYALIPLSLEQTYSSPPLTHKIIRHDNYLEVWNINRWTPNK
jgi:hypothetical protein